MSDTPKPLPGGEWHERAKLPGLGPDAPMEVNAQGGRQSAAPYPMHIMPARAILEVAAVMKRGLTTHGRDNWKQIPVEDHWGKATTHLLAHQAGDRSEGPIGHLSHAACRALMALQLAIEEEDRRNAAATVVLQYPQPD